MSQALAKVKWMKLYRCIHVDPLGADMDQNCETVKSRSLGSKDKRLGIREALGRFPQNLVHGCRLHPALPLRGSFFGKVKVIRVKGQTFGSRRSLGGFLLNLVRGYMLPPELPLRDLLLGRSRS